jgi:hypothetical protein
VSPGQLSCDGPPRRVFVDGREVGRASEVADLWIAALDIHVAIEIVKSRASKWVRVAKLLLAIGCRAKKNGHGAGAPLYGDLPHAGDHNLTLQSLLTKNPQTSFLHAPFVTHEEIDKMAAAQPLPQQRQLVPPNSGVDIGPLQRANDQPSQQTCPWLPPLKGRGTT